MKRPFRLLAAAALALVVGACDDDSTRPGVERSTIAIRAYVDANGSGSYDAQDVPLTGTTVTLTSGDASTRTATTDAQGLATFTDVDPGSYRATLAGAAPAGAVLASATSPVLAAPAFGETLAAEFRYVYNPGSVSGVLYRDDNASGVADEGDTPAPGIPVALYAGTDFSGEPVATTTTDGDGRYSFEGVRPGSYTLVFSPFPTMDLAGGDEQAVVVEAQAETSLDVSFTGNLLSTIAEARAAAQAGGPTVVAVEGVVGWQPGFNDEIFIQDETAGIFVFAGAVDASSFGLEIGDTVLVVGEAETRFGEVQLTRVATLIRRGSGPEPEPVAFSATRLNGGELQHQVVRIRAATVQEVEVLSFGNQFVTLTDLGGNEFGVYADSRTGVEADTWTVGGVYDVTGVTSYDNRYAFEHRIDVRRPEDVVAATAPLTVAEAISAPAGTAVTVRGVVSWQPVNLSGASFNDELFIQDATGGIQVFAAASGVRTLGLQPGDVVVVSGTTQDRFGERQITSTTSLVVVGEQDPPTAVLLTPAQIASGDFLHQLVTVADAEVVEVEVLSFDNQLVTLRAPNGAEFGLYVDSRTGVGSDTWTIGQTYDVTGVINYDDRYVSEDAPFPYRIWIRSPADVRAGS